MPGSTEELTVGIDIGTTSVKAVAVDSAGKVVRKARVAHRLIVPSPSRLEHDAAQAWRDGPLAALGELDCGAPAGIAVCTMIPSMTAVDDRGRPLGPGILYGDERGRGSLSGDFDPSGSRETAELVAWMAAEFPGAAGYWSAQAVANRAIGGPAAIDFGTALSSGALFDGKDWSEAVLADCGVGAAQLPEVRMLGEPLASLAGGTVLGAGGPDAFCDQLSAGPLAPGDVVVLCGSTLIVWAAVEGWPEVDGLWTLPSMEPGVALVGGPSNAGGLFLDWVDRLVRPADGLPEPEAVPVWRPYLRGERAVFNDPDLRGSLAGIDLTHGPAAVRRAAYEASAFAARHIIDTAGVTPRRLVATGGGTRSRGWIQALADATGATVELVSVPEGAALGAAWLARMAAGLETAIEGAFAWASKAGSVDPDPLWAEATAERYQRFRG